MKRRLQLAAGMGVAIALGETLAALSLASDDWAFLALQALVAFAVGLAVAFAPVPLRALPAVPLIAIGLFHGLRILHERGGLGAADYALLALHTLLTLVLVWRAGGRASEPLWINRALALFGMAYVAQALWIARFAIPVTLSEWRFKASALVIAATLAPLAAVWIAARLLERKRTYKLELAGLIVLAVIPFVAHRAWLWRAHEQTVRDRGVASGNTDVLLIVLDTVRADRMSLYGNAHPTTPNLERFAQTATVYERAQSQGIWTLPSHASLFTGMYPSEHRADWLEHGMNAQRLARDAVTLAERFQLAGYRTGCIAANKAIFGADFGLTQGFESAWAELGQVAQLWVPFVTSEIVHKLAGQSARQRIGALEQNQFAPAQEINRLALDWLPRAAHDAPRFLFLNYMEAHGQLRRPPCAAPLFGDGEPFGEWDLPDEQVAAVLAGTADADPAHLQRFRDWYDNQIACLDQHVGELFDALRERGLFDRMLIVVTSDHGHMLGDHRALKHQVEIWQGLVGVPLMIKMPGQTEAARCSEVVQTADVVPALVRWLGLPVSETPPAWAGTVDVLAKIGVVGETPRLESVAPCMLPTRSNTPVSEAGRMGELAVKFPARYDTSWTALVDGTLKYVVLGNGTRRVTDLANDPHETLRELTAAENERCDELIAAWRAGLIEPLDPSALADSAEAQRRLRALQQQGYVGK